MITLIVSDLHVGDFKSGHEDFYKFLNKQPDIDKLVIAGDFFDLWVASVGRALKEGQYLLEYLIQRFGPNVVYLTGNHDEDFQHVKSINGIPVKQYHKLEVNGKKILVFHGHQYDSNFYLNEFGFVARFNAWLVNKTDKLFGIDTRKWLVSLSEGIENDPYDKLLLTYELRLKQEFTNIHDVVITGHTHLPALKSNPGFAYVNTGDWMQHRTGVVIDDSDGSLSLVEYKNGEIQLIDVMQL